MQTIGPQSLPFNNVGTFVFLLTLAITRPESLFPGLGLPVGPLCLIAAAVILPLRICKTIGFAAFWAKYKWPLVLIASYQLLCLISLILNADRFTNIGDLLRWGLTFIAGQMLLPICVFIFLLPQPNADLADKNSRYNMSFLGLTTLVIILMPILQTYADGHARFIQYYTVAWTLAQHNSSPTNGLFATSTDLGAIMGIILFLIIWSLCHFRRVSFFFRICLVFLSLGALYSGLLSGSRIFILFILCSILITSSLIIRQHFFLSCSALLITAAILLNLPNDLRMSLSENLPFLAVLGSEAPPGASDFWPNLTLSAFGHRGDLWATAMTLIEDHLWLGVSNGGFRLHSSSSPNDNTHNLFLQALIDAGIFGLLIVLSLLALIWKTRYRNIGFLSLTGGIVTTLMVDNFTDHSYSWAVIAAYACACVGKSKRDSAFN